MPAGAMGTTPDLGPCGTWQVQPPAGTMYGSESGSGPAVTALGPSDVWIVGTSIDGVLGVRGFAEHWDGASWTVTPVPPPADVADELEAVTAVSPTDVWATGWQQVESNGLLPLAEHWDGSQWTKVPTPAIHDTHAGLQAVSALATDDVWAVGSVANGGQTLTLHWDGTAWTQVASPSPAANDNLLLGVAAVSADDAWAVGWQNGGLGDTPLIEHWDGTNWSVSAPPKEGDSGRLTAVAAVSANDVWAVGDSYTETPLIEHWNGTKWKLVSVTPWVSLTAISVVSKNDIWVAGGGRGFAQGAIEHWDGTTWTESAAPLPFWGVAAADDANVWATSSVVPTSSFQRQVEHFCPAAVSDWGFSPSTIDVSVDSSVTWRVPADATQAHSVSDATGTGLFDSGSLAPGAWWSYRFTAAGTFSVSDATTGQTATVAVALGVDQRPNKNGKYNITWAGSPPPAGFVYDVQVQTPASSTWEYWRHAVSTTTARYRPVLGSGTYSFRARLRNPTTHAKSKWSPAGSFVVP